MMAYSFSRSLARVAMLFILPAACSTAVTRESFIPIPEHPPGASAQPHVRGLTRTADVLSAQDQLAIMGEVVRRFYRPMMQQARWIDPRPLAHERTRAADTLMSARPDWALGIVDAARVDRVCPLDMGHARCHGLAGGVLRFSPAYAIGRLNTRGADSALVYVRYSPLSSGVESELEFFMTRTADGWRVVSRRTMPDILAASPVAQHLAPRESLDSLLAVDRAFAAAARDTHLVTALTSMFVDNVFLQAQGGFIRGRDSATQAMRVGSDAPAKVEWTPVKGGIASDGQHGFTAGYMTVTHDNGVRQPMRYVAYWVRSESGWRIAAYKRVAGPRGGEPSRGMLPPSLPVHGLSRGDEATMQRYADELSLAEHAFSRDAQPMGLGPAFAKWGAPDAINAGGPADTQFVVGPEAIARSVSAGLAPGTEITWRPDRVVVSSTGDLGVSIGTIRITPPAPAGVTATTREVPFFTIWKRAYPTDPWRYVAE